ncbi:MAG: thioredoxin [Armatimonadota bacterium]
MSKATDVTAADFDQEVIKSAIPVLVDFWAEWCGPCKMIAPSVDAIAEEYSGKLKVLKVNVDKEPTLAGLYGVMSIPTLILFKNGEVVEQITGAMPKQKIVDRISPHLA